MRRIIVLLPITLLVSILSHFQAGAQLINEGQLHGNFLFDGQYYNENQDKGMIQPPELFLSNSYANFSYIKGNFSAGLRYEGYLNTLMGYDSRNDGVGIPFRYISYNADKLGITVGNFYEQFGNGLILRTYEEKALGYDNAIDGIRITYNLSQGVYLKGIIGKQRTFFETSSTIVRGLDGEVFINDLLENLQTKKTQISLGGSFISKYSEDTDPIYILPENVGSFAGRFNISRGSLNLGGEYAYKINDPSKDNGFIYKYGDAILVNASYSRSGLGIFLSAKRIDNMSYRSDIYATQNNLMINYIPSITKLHTYGLAAKYPYATQPNGEMGFQAEIIYNFKKGSVLGGKYGTNIDINYSEIHNLPTTPTFDGTGYTSDYSSIGEELYFRDMNITIHKKISKSFKGDISYYNIAYNKDVIQGMAGYGIVYANIFVADLTYKPKPRHSIRTELQLLLSEQDKDDWAMGVLEYAIAPKWFFNITDQINYGNPNKDHRYNYFLFSFGYKKGGNKIQLSFGEQPEGINCIGGTCNYYPPTSGARLLITSSF